MNNEFIAEQFSLLAKLYDLHGENSFKAKSYANAAFQIDRLGYELLDLPHEKIASIQGIGNGVANKIIEIITSGQLQELNEWIAKTPRGVLEIMSIKGVGPKKVAVIWKEMGIESVGELLHACNENRLVQFKGFGAKVQQGIKESIEFYLGAQGKFLYAEVEESHAVILQYLQNLLPDTSVIPCGEFVRQLEIIESLSYLVLADPQQILRALENDLNFIFQKQETEALLYKYGSISLRLLPATNSNAALKQFCENSSTIFEETFFEKFPHLKEFVSDVPDDALLFAEAKLPFVPPYLREYGAVITKAIDNRLPKVIQYQDIKGVIHNHSKWSDGVNTIAEMANACIQKGYEYFVISDHSKIATYANGLSEDVIISQHKEVDELNKQLSPFKIFKSIECDILNDGSLDYDDEVLSGFDFVIASVHSNLKMDQEKAMQRLLTAIENPFTSILGHMSGRLLLSREGYPLDMKKIIDACAANEVVIELNANPHRLDIDWRWIDYALGKDVLISINPDAHSISGIGDIRYGVLAAQKAGVEAWQNLSCFSLSDFNEFLMGQYAKRP